LTAGLLFGPAGCKSDPPYGLRCVDSVYGLMDESYLYSSDTGLAKLPVPESPGEGITFAGWYKNGDLSDTPVTEIAPGTKGQLMLVAVWMLDTSYLDINGNVLAKVQVPYGQPYTSPKAPEIEGMAFTGWSDPDIFYAAARQPHTFIAQYESLPSSEEVFSPVLTAENAFHTLGEGEPEITYTLKAPADCVKVILRRVSPNAAYRYLAEEDSRRLAELAVSAPETLYTYWDSVSLQPGDEGVTCAVMKSASLWQITHSFGQNQAETILAECIRSDGSRVYATHRVRVFYPVIGPGAFPALTEQAALTGEPVPFLIRLPLAPLLRRWKSVFPPQYTVDVSWYWDNLAAYALVGEGAADVVWEEALVLKTTPDDTSLDRETDLYGLNEQLIPEGYALGVFFAPISSVTRALAYAGRGETPDNEKDPEAGLLLEKSRALLSPVLREDMTDEEKLSAVLSLLTDLQRKAGAAGEDTALGLLKGGSVSRKGAAEACMLLLRLAGLSCAMTAAGNAPGGAAESFLRDTRLCVAETESGKLLIDPWYSKADKITPSVLAPEDAAARFTWYSPACGGPDLTAPE
jgi:hypothetical protein